ncbi:hypothetical protein [Microlunatus ginsengisoli]|uniref:Uncharacterized protein n=1 Tax=Microlunatus ginsengisoli TaxID=363863 RepID=A0ABP6ZER9_9ACTN
MSRRPEERRRRWPSLWRLVPAICEVAVLVIVVLAAGVVAASLIRSGQSWLGFVPPLLVLIGIAAGYRLPWLGLVVVALAAPVAALVGEVPVGTWSMVCFAAFLFAMQWLPGWAVAAVLAPVNFVSAGDEVAAVVAGHVEA